MRKIIEILYRLNSALRGRHVMARFDTGAELVIRDRQLANAVVVDCDGRHYTLGAYISQFMEQSPSD